MRLLHVRSCVLLLLFTSALLGEAVSASTAASAERSEAAASRAVDELLKKRHRKGAPGCAVSVSRAGKILHSGAFGMANLEHGVPITPRTVFDIGSASKQFTAASIVLLAKEGKLSLDDDIRKHLPEMPTYGAPVRIRHLLNHTAGLRDYNRLLTMAGLRVRDVSTMADAYSLVTRQRGIHFEPGSEYEYSNTGYLLAAEIVARVAKQPFTEFTSNRIFAPLGMGSSGFRDDGTSLVQHRAIGYSSGEKGTYRINVSNWEQVGDGALLTTVEDLAKWAANFQSGRVGGPGLFKALQTRGVLNDGTAIDYALGLSHGTEAGLDFVQHNGAWGGYASDFRYFPAERVAVTALCNDSDAPPEALTKAISEIYLRPAQAAPTAGAAPAALPTVDLLQSQLEAWSGDYMLQSGGVVRIARNDAALVAKARDWTFHLRPVAADRFEVVDDGLDGTYIHFRSDGAARSAEILVKGTRVERLRGLRPALAGAADLSPYAGTFECSEVLTTRHVRVAEGALLLQHAPPRVGGTKHQPLGQHQFLAGDTLLTFGEPASGKSQYFIIDRGRARGVRCNRTP